MAIKKIKFDDLKNPENASIYRSVLFFNRITKHIDDVDCWIAGGCFRAYFQPDEKISDIDIFTTNRSECAKLIWRLRKIGFKPFFKNKNAIKGFLKLNGKTYYIDVVKRFYENQDSCIIDFDFSVSKFALHSRSKDVSFTENYFADLISKRIVIPDTEYGNPLGSLKRLQKYIQKGYEACNGSILTIAKRLSVVDYSDPNQNDIEFYPDGNVKIILFD